MSDSREEPVGEEALEAGLREVFGARRREASGEESVIDTVSRETGARPSVMLHSAKEDATPVLRLVNETTAEAISDARYQVLGEIARGGVGVVLKSRDKDLGRDVAIKVLRKEYAERADVVARFVEEAQIGGQLLHPGIVPVYGLGLQPDGRPYFAMKLVKGRTLWAEIAITLAKDEK